MSIIIFLRNVAINVAQNKCGNLVCSSQFQEPIPIASQHPKEHVELVLCRWASEGKTLGGLQKAPGDPGKSCGDSGAARDVPWCFWGWTGSANSFGYEYNVYIYMIYILYVYTEYIYMYI